MKTFIAMLNTELNTGSEGRIQLFPAGSFRGRDGRPENCASWVLNATLAAQLIAQVSAQENTIVIDYEHQTFNAQSNGQPAPAAGWFKQLEWVEGVGLFATDVQWTGKAADMIAANEYKYISPVFLYDKSGNVVKLINAALTNQPALDGMEAVMAAAASYYFSSAKEESPMDDLLERLQWLLNLPITATAEDIVAQLDILKAQIIAATGESTAAANFDLLSYLTDNKTQIAALTEQVKTSKVDMSQFVPIDVFHEQQQQIAQLTAQHKASEIEQLITAACSDGRVRGEKMESWLRQTAKDNPKAAREFIDNLPSIAALTSIQTGGNPPKPEEKQAQLDKETLAMCKSMGVDPKDYIATRQEIEQENP